MRIKFSLKRSPWIAETIGQNIIVYLRECYSLGDIMESLKHEPIHAAINKLIGTDKTSEKQDHFIIRRMDIEQF